MIEVIWEPVKNLTPNSAICPRCGETQTLSRSKWEMWQESPLTGKIMVPLCCPGFWAIWRRGYEDWWEFKNKSWGRYGVQRSIVEGMCIKTIEDKVLMCDKVVHPSGEVDAIPKYVARYPAGFICKSYAFPRSRVRIGGCALCSIPTEEARFNQKKLNPLKASKRARR